MPTRIRLLRCLAVLVATLGVVPGTALAHHVKRPSVSTGGVSWLAADSATLTGSVYPSNVATSYHFDYGTSTYYGQSTPVASLGATSSWVSVQATVSGLTSGVTYHFRLVATNSAGTTYGADATFTTPSVSSMSTSTSTTSASTTASTSMTTSTTTTTTSSSVTVSQVEGGPQTGWVAPGTVPLSDAQAAALVTREPETRSENVQANDYVPTDAQLQAFHAATDSYGHLADGDNPLRRYVTGRPGLSNPSTDDLMQWVAHKWGIPENWVRAMAVQESWWRSTSMGDLATVSSSWYGLYPPQARIAGTSEVDQSMGLTSIKWTPDGQMGAGTEPLRWQSDAFNLDYWAASVRYYYDGLCSWCGSGYSAGQQWNSIGAWFEPTPWNNSGQQNYISEIQGRLTNQTWAQPGFPE